MVFQFFQRPLRWNVMLSLPPQIKQCFLASCSMGSYKTAQVGTQSTWNAFHQLPPNIMEDPVSFQTPQWRQLRNLSLKRIEICFYRHSNLCGVPRIAQVKQSLRQLHVDMVPFCMLSNQRTNKILTTCALRKLDSSRQYDFAHVESVAMRWWSKTEYVIFAKCFFRTTLWIYVS